MSPKYCSNPHLHLDHWNRTAEHFQARLFSRYSQLQERLAIFNNQKLFTLSDTFPRASDAGLGRKRNFYRCGYKVVRQCKLHHDSGNNYGCFFSRSGTPLVLEPPKTQKTELGQISFDSWSCRHVFGGQQISQMQISWG